MRKQFSDRYPLLKRPKVIKGAPIKMIDLPGFRELEDHLLTNLSSTYRMDSRREAEVERMSIELFGITAEDTKLEPTEDDWLLPNDRREQVLQRCDAHERKFKTERMTDLKAMGHLLDLGLDFRNDYGQPMHSMRLFSRQAEAASHDILGARFPDKGAVELERFEASLRRDAEKFQRDRRQT